MCKIAVWLCYLSRLFSGSAKLMIHLAVWLIPADKPAPVAAPAPVPADMSTEAMGREFIRLLARNDHWPEDVPVLMLQSGASPSSVFDALLAARGRVQ
jgi:hypothetical protein